MIHVVPHPAGYTGWFDRLGNLVVEQYSPSEVVHHRHHLDLFPRHGCVLHEFEHGVGGGVLERVEVHPLVGALPLRKLVGVVGEDLVDVLGRKELPLGRDKRPWVGTVKDCKVTVAQVLLGLEAGPPAELLCEGEGRHKGCRKDGGDVREMRELTEMRKMS